MCKGLMYGKCTVTPGVTTMQAVAAPFVSGRLCVTAGPEGPVFVRQKGLGEISVAAGATLTVFVDDVNMIEFVSPVEQSVDWAFQVMDVDPVLRFQEYVRRAAQKKRERDGA